jgi:hypothetical protein
MMNIILLLFIAMALSLIGLLFWAVKPPRIKFKSVEEVFEALSGQRHYQRLPQILQSLQSKDTEYLAARVHSALGIGSPSSAKRSP